MKKIFLSILILAAAVQAKAKIKPVTPFALKPLTPLKSDTSNLLSHQSQPMKKAIVNFDNFYDPMPIAKLQGSSKMPIVKLYGYSRMPNAYRGTIPDSTKVKNLRIIPLMEIQQDKN